MDSIKNKSIKGVSWSLIDNFSNFGITFLVGLILARILSTSDFGIIGMITIFIALSNSIVDSGFSSALIRKENVSNIDYNTVFYVNLFLGTGVYILLFFCATSISQFFNEPILIPIIKSMGSILIINAFGIVQRTILVKKVDFKTQTKISLIASITSGIIGVGMALLGLGVWSIVGQQISRQFLNTFFLWFFSSWRPVLVFSITSFKELFGFGSKLLLSGLIDTTYRNIYYLVIGKFYAVDQLGQYTRAEQFNSVFSSNLSAAVQRVSYPILSEIKTNEDRLKHAFSRILKMTMLVSFSCMLGLAALSKPLIVILIGEKWLESVKYLQIICFSGMLYPLQLLNLNILMVKGRSDLFLKLEIIKKTISIVPIMLGIYFGIEFMLWGSVFISCISFVVNSYYSKILINYNTWSQVKDIFPSFLIAFVISASIWSLTLLNFSNYVTLFLQSLLGIILSFGVYEIYKSSEYIELKDVLLSRIIR